MNENSKFEHAWVKLLKEIYIYIYTDKFLEKIKKSGKKDNAPLIIKVIILWHKKVKGKF